LIHLISDMTVPTLKTEILITIKNDSQRLMKQEFQGPISAVSELIILHNQFMGRIF
jgi:hypothetical protein